MCILKTNEVDANHYVYFLRNNLKYFELISFKLRFLFQEWNFREFIKCPDFLFHQIKENKKWYKIGFQILLYIKKSL